MKIQAAVYNPMHNVDSDWNRKHIALNKAWLGTTNHAMLRL